MRPPPRRSRAIPLVAITGFCFFLFSISFISLAVIPSDFSPPLQHRQLISENAVLLTNFSHWKAIQKLNSVEQEVSGGLKEPPGTVLKDSNYHEPATDVGNESTGGFRDDDAGKEVQEQKIVLISEGKEKSTQVSAEQSGFSWQRPIINEKVSEMEDQLIMAKTYLQFKPPNSNSHLVRELKLRIKEMQRVLGHSRRSSVLRGILQKMRAMEDTLSKANKAYPDCSALASKLCAVTHNSEEQLRQQMNQASFLIELAASTFPKGLHCLSMQLTTDYFTLKPEDRQLPNRDKVRKENLYLYAIFSDNILACAVAVNSTISSSRAPCKIVIHIVTDSLNFPAMTMWFLLNRPGQATIEIQKMDDFKLLPPDFSSMVKQSGV